MCILDSQRNLSFADESGCEADMLEGAEAGRHSPPRPQQEPINLKNEVGDYHIKPIFYSI